MPEKIVKVRALAAVDSKGEWCVFGCSGASDAYCVKFVQSSLYTDHCRKYWVELELDLPEEIGNFEAKVIKTATDIAVEKKRWFSK